MTYNSVDLKIYMINAATLATTTFGDVESYLKISLLVVTIGYTISKWIGVKKKNDEADEKL